MRCELNFTLRLLGSLLTLVVGSGAAYLVAEAGLLAALGLGLVLAGLVYGALSVAGVKGGIRGLSGHRLVAFVLVLALALVALGVTFWMQPDIRYAGAIAIVLFASAAFYVVAALLALGGLRRSRAGHRPSRS